MLINIECIPCLLKMADAVIKRLGLEEKTSKAIFKEIMEIPTFRGRHWNTTSGQVIERIMIILSKAIGDANPFKLEKEKQNKMVMDLYPYFNQKLEMAPDPLFEALKFSILGNSIDFMTMNGTPIIKNTFEKKRNIISLENNYEQFLKKIDSSKRILYIGDNAGEIVLDKILIEILLKEYGCDVTFVTRSVPTLNDVTMEEARYVGMNQAASLVENGVDGPLAGTLLNRISQEIIEAMDQADLIISKGGGNFETLQEEFKKIDTDISFLLVSKCRNYVDLFGVPIGDPILFNRHRE